MINTIALLGPKGTFSERALDCLLEKVEAPYEKMFVSTISDAVDAVERGGAKYALIPIENSTYGTVRESFDALFVHDVKIINEYVLKIHHALGSLKPANFDTITEVYGHEQAIGQCKGFLKRNCAQAELHSVASSVKAIEMVVERGGSAAALAPYQSIIDNSLHVIAQNVDDSSSNQTTFALVGSQTGVVRFIEPHGGVAIAFTFDKDKAGSLLSICTILAEHSINMTRIESRPAITDPGNYHFFIDFSGSLTDENVKQALKKISLTVAKLKVLGDY